MSSYGLSLGDAPPDPFALAADILDPPSVEPPDPVDWIHERLGEETWSKQDEILRSLLTARKTAVASCHGIGKPVATDTPIATPAGWATLGALRVGDRVFDEQGRPCRVTGKGPVLIDDLWRVSFADGTVVDARGSHEWVALDLMRRPRGVKDWRDRWDASGIVTTAEIASSLRTPGGQRRWRVPTARPLDLPAKALPVDPYVLGCWLGDGDTSSRAITLNASDAAEMVPEFERRGCVVEYVPSRCHGVERRDVFRCRLDRLPTSALRDLGVLNAKHIPMMYQRASVDQRIALVRGLMDTDGYRMGAAEEITLTDGRLFDGFVSVLRSLGLLVRTSVGETKIGDVSYGPKYRANFRPDFNPYTLTRYRWTPRGSQGSRHTQRTIVDVQRIPDRPSQCIEVDSPSHLFLAGEGMVPTHNSWLASRAAAWWIDSHPAGEAKVVTSAPSQDQVRKILWNEIRQAHRKGDLPGGISMAQIPEWTIDGQIVAFGRKGADRVDPNTARTMFQGIHARYLLVILDEACGIPEWLWDAVMSLTTGEDGRVLAIGNPDDPATRFAKNCAPGTDWNVMAVSAFDAPAFTGEPVSEYLRASLVSRQYVEDAEKEWGVESPLYISKVLGQFPEVADDVIITPRMVRLAQERDLSGQAVGAKKRFGMDVARFGCHDDQTEVLTDHGWRLFGDLTGGERVLSRHADGVAAWEPITEVHRYPHVGPMVLYDGERLNFCVTENHRMLAAPAHHGAASRWIGDPVYRLRRWDECPEEFIAPRQVEWLGVEPGTFHFSSRVPMPYGGERRKDWEFEARDWFAFLGWFISEGNVYHERRGAKRVVIAQTGGHMAAIRALLDRMGIKHRLTSNRVAVEFSIRAIADHLDAACGRGAPNKRIPGYVLDAPPHLMERFLDTYCDGDGSRRDGRRQSYFTTSRALADGVQEMLVKLGRAGTTGRVALAGSTATIDGRTLTRGYDCFATTEVARVRHASIAKRRARVVRYVGDVFCVSTPHHTIMTRRNGCTLWAGNSDETCIYEFRGGVLRLVEAWRKADTDVSRRKAQTLLEMPVNRYSAMTVDVVGLGAGVVDPLRAQGFPVRPFNGGEAAADPARFVNRNAESWWALREGLEAGLVDLDPADLKLAAQLQSRKWKLDSSQRRIRVETKDEMRERGIPSPDRGDGAVMAYYELRTVEDPAVVMRQKPGEDVASITGDLLTLRT